MLGRWFVAVLVVLLPGVPLANVIFEDHFDDGVLDPAWELVFSQHACGWTYLETGTDLHVTDVCHNGPSSEWARVYLRRPCVLSGDFTATSTFSWDSHGLNSPMQTLFVVLRNTSADPVVQAGYHDAWILHRGEIAAFVDSVSYQSGWDSLIWADAATLVLRRTGNQITISWNDQEVLSAQNSDTFVSADIMFGYAWWPDTNTFIDESVDYIGIESLPPVTVPAAAHAEDSLRLSNAPNPFTRRTAIRFHLDSPQQSRLTVHDVGGRLIALLYDGPSSSGWSEIVWDARRPNGSPLTAGVYVYRLETSDRLETGRMVLLK